MTNSNPAKSSPLFLVEREHTLEEILNMPSSRVLDANPEELSAFYDLSWNDIIEMDYEDAAAVAARHEDILAKGSRKQIEKIAGLQAEEVLKKNNGNGDNKLNTLNYLKHLLDQGKLSPEVYDALIEGENEAVSFQRVVRTNTGKYYTKEGMLIEKVKIYPENYRLMEFTSFYSDEKTRKISCAAQEFYFQTAKYAKQRLEAIDITEEGKLLLEKLERLEAISPLNSGKKRLDNLFVRGRDMKDELSAEDPSVDERVKYLEEITSIDIIMAYFSQSFKEGEGKKLYKKPGLVNKLRGKKLCDSQDYHIFIAEKIIIPSDEKLREYLQKEKIIDSNGKIRNPESFSAFYENDTSLGKVMELLGVNDTPLGDNFFCVSDPNLGNVMVSKNGKTKYTMIDFDNVKEDTVVSGLFKRWINSGIYNMGESKEMSNGMKAEDYLLDSAYKTLEMQKKATDQDIMSREAFDKEFRMQKKIYLLNKARRYKSLRHKDENKNKMKDYMRYNFTLFVNELIKEGKIESNEDKGLEYLIRLFGEPLDRDKMREIKGSYDPDFSSHEELSPLVFRDLKKEWDNETRRYKTKKRLGQAKKAGIAGLVGLLLAGLGAGAYVYYGRTKELSVELKEDAKIAEWMPLFTQLNNSVMGGFKRYANYTLFNQYEIIFQDRRTAMAACLNLEAVYEASEHAGMRINYNYIENYNGESLRMFSIPYDRIEDYLKKHYPKIHDVIRDSSDNYVDSWFIKGAYGMAKDKIKKLSIEARGNLKKKKGYKNCSPPYTDLSGCPNPQFIK